MKKRVLMILMTCILGSAGTLSPVCHASAQENAAEEAAQESAEGTPAQEEDKGILEQGAEFGSDLYQKMDDAVDNMDKESLRKSIREALEEMDDRGISPTAVAENVFGLKPGNAGSGKTPGNVLIEDAQREVRKKTEGFFSVLWNGFLDTLQGMFETGMSIFSSPAEGGAKGGSK